MGEWRGLTRLATVERHGRNGNIAVCMLKGYGIRNGAVATSVSHDAHNVVCAGDNAADMAVACNRLRELGGGYTIASDGRIVGELPLPAYGLMSAENAATVAETIHRLEGASPRHGREPPHRRLHDALFRSPAGHTLPAPARYGTVRRGRKPVHPVDGASRPAGTRQAKRQ